MNKELIELQEIMEQEENWDEKLAGMLQIEQMRMQALLTNQEKATPAEEQRMAALRTKLKTQLSLGGNLEDILFYEELQMAVRRVGVKQRSVFLEALEYLALCFKDVEKEE